MSEQLFMLHLPNEILDILVAAAATYYKKSSQFRDQFYFM